MNPGSALEAEEQLFLSKKYSDNLPHWDATITNVLCQRNNDTSNSNHDTPIDSGIGSLLSITPQSFASHCTSPSTSVLCRNYSSGASQPQTEDSLINTNHGHSHYGHGAESKSCSYCSGYTDTVPGIPRSPTLSMSLSTASCTTHSVEVLEASRFGTPCVDMLSLFWRRREISSEGFMLWEVVLNHLSPADLRSMAQVNQSWNCVTADYLKYNPTKRGEAQKEKLFSEKENRMPDLKEQNLQIQRPIKASTPKSYLKQPAGAEYLHSIFMKHACLLPPGETVESCIHCGGPVWQHWETQEARCLRTDGVCGVSYCLYCHDTYHGLRIPCSRTGSSILVLSIRNTSSSWFENLRVSSGDKRKHMHSTSSLVCTATNSLSASSFISPIFQSGDKGSCKNTVSKASKVGAGQTSLTGPIPFILGGLSKSPEGTVHSRVTVEEIHGSRVEECKIRKRMGDAKKAERKKLMRRLK